MRALLLPVGGDTWCVPLERVLEVVVLPGLRPVPLARPEALGVFNLRGEVVPVFDTSRLLGLGPSTARHGVLLDLGERRRAALTSSDVPRAVTLGPSSGPAEHPAALGEHDVDGGEVAVLLDVERLWS